MKPVCYWCSLKPRFDLGHSLSWHIGRHVRSWMCFFLKTTVTVIPYPDTLDKFSGLLLNADTFKFQLDTFRRPLNVSTSILNVSTLEHKRTFHSIYWTSFLFFSDARPGGWWQLPQPKKKILLKRTRLCSCSSSGNRTSFFAQLRHQSQLYIYCWFRKSASWVTRSSMMQHDPFLCPQAQGLQQPWVATMNFD